MRDGVAAGPRYHDGPGQLTGSAMTYRAVVIDDQDTARRGIALSLGSLAEVEIVGEFSDAETALRHLPSLDPDLVYLDIQMRGLDGLELARRIPDGDVPAFIFVTAYDEHAVTAFELAAADYVLKPFTDDRLLAATRRGIEKVESARSRATLKTLRETIAGGGAVPTPTRAQPTAEPRYVTVRDGDRIHFVPVSEIAWLEAERNDVRLHAGSREHLVHMGLGKMLETLGSRRFIRVHRSHAVNVDAVREIQPWFNGDYVAILRDGEQLRISRRYKDAILKRVL